MPGMVRLPNPPKVYDDKWANQYTRALEQENQQLWNAVQNLLLTSLGGTVTDFVFTDANGISGVVTTSTTTPTLVLDLGDIAPTSITTGAITASDVSTTTLGVGTATLVKVLLPLTTKTANYAINSATDYTVICTTNAFTVTLPTAAGIAGQRFVVKNGNTVVSGNDITMATTSAQTIDGAAPGVITGMAFNIFASDGANWWTV